MRPVLFVFVTLGCLVVSSQLFGQLQNGGFEEWTKISGQSELPIHLTTANQDDSWFKDMQLINLERLQNPETFELNNTEEDLLFDIAYSESPIRSFARSMLSLLVGEEFEPDFVMPGRQINLSTGFDTLISTSKHKILIYPNLTKGIINFTSSIHIDEEVKFELYNTTGILLFEDVVNMSNINVSNIENGIYFYTIRFRYGYIEYGKVILN